MANTGLKGIDIRQTGNELVFRASLKDSAGAKITSGTTSLYLFELQSDGTLKSYDFSDNTFKTTALTTASVSMTHRQGNNSTYNTGVWTYSLATLTGFTVGAVYIAQIFNSAALPTEQEREFQYGSAEGDLVTTANGTGAATIDSQAIKVGPSGAGTAQTARDIGASVLLSAGTGAGQLDFTSGVIKSNLVQILGTALTETAGQIAAAFKKFFNVSTPASTMDTLTSVGAVSGNVGGNVVGSVGSVTSGVTVTTNNDKTGYALATGEHAAIGADVLDASASAHNTAGTVGNKINAAASAGDPWATSLPGSYGAGTAGKLVGDNVNASIAAVKAKTDGLNFTGANVQSTPQTNVNLNLAQAIPASNTSQTVGDALNAARAQGFGKWILSSNTLTLYAADGVTVVRSFTLDSTVNPTSRI